MEVKNFRNTLSFQKSLDVLTRGAKGEEFIRSTFPISDDAALKLKNIVGCQVQQYKAVNLTDNSFIRKIFDAINESIPQKLLIIPDKQVDIFYTPERISLINGFIDGDRGTTINLYT